MTARSFLIGAFGLLLAQMGMTQTPLTAPPPPPVRVVLVGDSTVQSHSGWGDAFAPLLKSQVECINRGLGGRSSKSYRAEGHWDEALALKPNYILIQFGHNDEPGKGPARETDPDTTYATNLARYIDEARQAGAQPILVTSLTRRNFDEHGKIHSTLTPYVATVKRVAEAKQVPLVDLNARSTEQMEKLGPAGADELNAVSREPGKQDRTHLNEKGAAMTAPLVAAELRRIGADLARYLRSEGEPAGK